MLNLREKGSPEIYKPKTAAQLRYCSKTLGHLNKRLDLNSVNGMNVWGVLASMIGTQKCSITYLCNAFKTDLELLVTYICQFLHVCKKGVASNTST